MTERTALELAEDIESRGGPDNYEAADMLRSQHAEIARLKANAVALTMDRDIRRMTEARNAELQAEIARLKAIAQRLLGALADARLIISPYTRERQVLINITKALAEIIPEDIA